MSDNKWKFSAKRIDGGSVIEGRITYSHSGNDAICFCDIDGMWTEVEIDPSTIKPLFTTDKPDAWLFENVDNKPLIDCNDWQIGLIYRSCIEANNEQCQLYHDGVWAFQSMKIKVRENGIYRVKAPVYTLKDALSVVESVWDSSDISTIERADLTQAMNRLAASNGSNDE